MEDLIAIALFYSYIVNGERELRDYELRYFINDVKETLSNLRSEYKIGPSRASHYYDSIPCEIQVRNENEKQILSAMQEKPYPFKEKSFFAPTHYYSFGMIEQDFLRWFSWLDKDLVCATLSENALEHLDIKREELPIKSKVDYRSGRISIYSLKESDAYDSAIRGLELDGFMDVSVGRGVPIQPDDKAYSFSFTGKKEMYALDFNNDKVFKAIAKLRTTLDMEAYKREVLSKPDENGKLNLDNLWLAKTSFLDENNKTLSYDYHAVLKSTGDEDAFYNRMVASMTTGTSDVTVFIDLLVDKVMNYSWQGRFSNKDYETVVDEIMPLSEYMNMECATLEEIEQYIDNLNKKPVIKELTPDN